MGHLLVRFALSEASGRHPGEIVIERGPTGKPYSPNLGIQWSLSHTNGAAAVCISSAPVGVDAERIGPVRQRVLRRVLSPREQAYVLSRPEGQEARFFEVWTRKEAAVKRDGRGLSINLHSVDTFSDDFGLFTTLQEGDFIVSVCGAAPLEERNILRLEEDALVRYFQGQPFSIP
jgi:4'-phosphopantetheinyl transferase